MENFVEGWLVYEQVLGEGAFGEVRLLVHKESDEKVACKIIDHSKYQNAKASIQKEITIHRLLNHENIIRYFGRREHLNTEFIYLEYAANGELFQMIEPDLGMSSGAAQHYMKQLCSGVAYLHKMGVAHRDIKPENLLIDGTGMLKICDFGMATIFRFKNKERRLDRRCGTKPYLAPEVFAGPYLAEPADLWSCGIVYVAMLTGELPWSEATTSSKEFRNWSSNDIDSAYLSDTPWAKLGMTALSLVSQILHVNPVKRATLAQILAHPWMQFKFDYDVSAVNNSDADNLSLIKQMSMSRNASMFEAQTRQLNYLERPRVTLSQPPSTLNELSTNISQLTTSAQPSVCFSQPVKNDDVILHLTQTSTVTKENFHCFVVRRMTRIYLTDVTRAEAVKRLTAVLNLQQLSWTCDAAGGAIVVEMVDAQRNALIFKISFIEITVIGSAEILLDFRLAKGCGLEFKKQFLKIKQKIVNTKN